MAKSKKKRPNNGPKTFKRLLIVLCKIKTTCIFFSLMRITDINALSCYMQCNMSTDLK